MRDGTHTREQIERSALHLFLHQGVAGGSMRDIVRKAGVSLGAVYNHYPSKEELAWALFSKGWSEIATEMRRRARAEKTLLAQLRAMIGYVFESFDADPDRVGYVFFSRHEHMARVDARLPNPHLVFRLFIASAIARGEARKMDPELATVMVMGAVIQMIDAKMLGRIKGALASRTAEIAGACHRMIRS